MSPVFGYISVLGASGLLHLHWLFTQAVSLSPQGKGILVFNFSFFSYLLTEFDFHLPPPLSLLSPLSKQEKLRSRVSLGQLFLWQQLCCL